MLRVLPFLFPLMSAGPQNEETEKQSLCFPLAAPQVPRSSHPLTCFKKSFPKVLSRVLYPMENIWDSSVLQRCHKWSSCMPTSPSQRVDLCLGPFL